MTVLETKELGKVFSSRGRSETAVDAISFNVSAGEVLAFLGANGAGKTTTIKMIAGLVSPTRGRVWIEGGDPGDQVSAVGPVDLGAELEAQTAA